VSVEISNVGHSPGVQFNYTIASPEVRPLTIQGVHGFRAGPNRTCAEIYALGHGITIYPSMLRHAYATMNNFSLTKDQTLIFKGCYVYQTLGIKHTSPFCQFTLPEDKPLQMRAFRYCDEGNEPD
jgi:hypothetical protein